MSKNKGHFISLWETQSSEIGIAFETKSLEMESFAVAYFPALDAAIQLDCKSDFFDSDDDGQGDTLTAKEPPLKGLLVDAYVWPHLFAKNLVRLLNEPQQTVDVINDVDPWKYTKAKDNEPGFDIYRSSGGCRNLFATVCIDVDEDDSDDEDENNKSKFSPATLKKLARLKQVIPKLMQTMTYLDNFASVQTLQQMYDKPSDTKPSPQETEEPR
jgi:hypothetical protein